MGEHTVTSFDDDLNEIDRLIRDMADLAGAMVGASIRALLASDNAMAQRVISDDTIMDARQRELDDRSITLIAKRQPMAQDLRMVLGAIRMAGDLERIGDLAKNIAKRVGAVGQSNTPRALRWVPPIDGFRACGASLHDGACSRSIESRLGVGIASFERVRSRFVRSRTVRFASARTRFTHCERACQPALDAPLGTRDARADRARKEESPCRLGFVPRA